nr:hypothetical protein [Glycomyces sp. NRRL B-16210]
MRERVLARGVELEHGSDVRGALGVDRDRVDLAAVDLLDNVEVPERGGTGSAAVLRLGLHLEGDVGARRPGLVFVDGVEDGPDHVAHVGVVGEVANRDQSDAELLELPSRQQRVGGIAVHPGAGVDDHVVDVAPATDAGHHLLEFRPVLHLER